MGATCTTRGGCSSRLQPSPSGLPDVPRFVAMRAVRDEPSWRCLGTSWSWSEQVEMWGGRAGARAQHWRP
jgi:hypothetical protein